MYQAGKLLVFLALEGLLAVGCLTAPFVLPVVGLLLSLLSLAAMKAVYVAFYGPQARG